MRIVADHAKCTGLGMCEAEAPELFEVQAAIDSCPTEALTLVED